MLEIYQPRDQSRRRRRAPLMRGKETHPFPLEEIPVDQRRELHQIMASVDHVDQPRAEQIILFGHAGMGLHRRSEFAGFLPKAYETLQIKANKTADPVTKSNVVEVVQIGLIGMSFASWLEATLGSIWRIL